MITISSCKVRLWWRASIWHQSWHYAAAFFVLYMVVIFPIWHSIVPVLSDYPNHLARMHILNEAGHSVLLKQFYEIHWAVLPNLAMDIVVPIFAKWVGIFVAGKLFLSLILLLIPSGTLALYYVLNGRMSPWPFTSFLFLYNEIFVSGVVNYLFGLGLAIWMITGWIACRQLSIRWRLPIFSVAATLLFFCHFSAFGIYAIAIVAYELQYEWEHRKRMLSWAYPLMALLTLLTPVLLLILFSPMGQGEGQGFSTQGLTTPVYISAMLFTKLLAPYVLVGTYNTWLDSAMVALLGVVVIRGYFAKVVRINKSMSWMLIVLAITFFLTPPVLFNSQLADSRLFIALAFIFIASADLKVAKPATQALVFSLLVCLFIVRISIVVNVWSMQEKVTQAYLRAMNTLPKGSRLFPAFSEQETVDYIGSFKEYLPCLAIITSSAFVPSLYSLRGSQPVWLSSEFQTIKKRSGGPLFSSGVAPNWTQIMRDFDYILIGGVEHFPLLPQYNLILTVRGPDFLLYRIIK